MNQKEKKVLEFLKNFYLANKYWPTYDEIAQACQFSKGYISTAIHSLVKQGRLIKPSDKARTFILVDPKEE